MDRCRLPGLCRQREAPYDLGNRKNEDEAKIKLREAQRARDAGLPAGRRDYTVRRAVESWLEHGLAGSGSEHSDEPDDLGAEASAACFGVSPADGANGR